MAIGIYTITNSTNGKQYVGSSKDIEKRWRSHIQRLNKGTHHSPHLQYAWNKYGRAAFVFAAIEEIAIHSYERLCEREQYYIDTLSPEYNATKIAGPSSMDPLVGLKISLRQRNRQLPPSWRANISQAMKDSDRVRQPKSLSHRKSIQRVMRNNWADPAYRAMILEARERGVHPTRGRPRSAQTRERIRLAGLGRIPWHAINAWSDICQRRRVTIANVKAKYAPDRNRPRAKKPYDPEANADQKKTPAARRAQISATKRAQGQKRPDLAARNQDPAFIAQVSSKLKGRPPYAAIQAAAEAKRKRREAIQAELAQLPPIRPANS